MRLEGDNPGMSFYVTGSDDEDSLVVTAELKSGRVALALPVAALPWRDLRLIEEHGGRHVEYGCGEKEDPAREIAETLKGEDVVLRTDVQGAEWMEVEGGIATFHAAGDTLVAPCLRIAEGARMPAVVRVFEARTKRPRGAVHVAQLAGGRRVGGVTVEFGTKRG